MNKSSNPTPTVAFRTAPVDTHFALTNLHGFEQMAFLADSSMPIG
jgi:hypothetical protein